MSTNAKQIRQYVARLQTITDMLTPNWVGTPLSHFEKRPLYEPDQYDLYLQHREELIDLHQRINSWMLTHPKTDFRKTDGNRHYLVTFTYATKDPKDPTKLNPYSKEQFRQGIAKTIEQRTTWCDYAYAFEHEETNIHCHAILATEYTLNHTNFKSQAAKYGTVHCVIINTDNGVAEYIKKESKPKCKPDGKLKNNFLDTK